MSASANDRVYLIDASVYVFRAYFSVPDNFVDTDGYPANAVYGFSRFVCDFLDQVRPSQVALAFDESLVTSFRNDIYAPYKANREPPPPELKRQFTHCRAIAEAMGITCFSHERFEADDFIGTLHERQRQRGVKTTVVTSDKDLTQLLMDGDEWWDYARNVRLDRDGVYQKFGVWPHQIVDYLALTGDAVDNIPGVPGIGPKTASLLLGHFESLDALLARLEEVQFLSMRGAVGTHKKLRDNVNQALLSRQLTEIDKNVPLPEPEPSLGRGDADMEELGDLFNYLKFGPLLRRRCESLAVIPGNAQA